MKTYTFHVNLEGAGRVWRKIEMRGDQTLEELHFAIQDAYGWDADHMYSFFMSGRAWDGSTEYTLPEGTDPWGLDLDDEEEEDEQIGDEEAGIDEEDMAEELDAMAGELVQLGITPERLQEGLAILEDDSLSPEKKLARVGPLAEALMGFIGDLGEPDSPSDVQVTMLDGLDLEVAKKFLYLFDYGDEHRFRVRVHAINPDAAEGDYPRIVESVGEAPEQYPSWDEEEDSDEDAEE